MPSRSLTAHYSLLTVHCSLLTSFFLVSGIISVCIGFAVWVTPYGSPLVSVMVGMDLFYSGLATIWIALAMRRTLEKREALCIGDICFSE